MKDNFKAKAPLLVALTDDVRCSVDVSAPRVVRHVTYTLCGYRKDDVDGESPSIVNFRDCLFPDRF